MSKSCLRLLLNMTTSIAALALAHGANAADAVAAPNNTPAMTGAGAEGTDVEQVVVTAERDRGAAEAPAKASLVQTQPESIISHRFIEQVTPETGDWTSVVAIAPSISGITSNGGNIGEYNKVTMRGFQDGQFNVTYDGISFGDTNDPTHHSASYFPASTIGAAVVDRGPGAAGDLGQANFGGAIHYFSPTATDKFGLTQKVTYGSFSTVNAVTTLNTGDQDWLGGGRLLLNFDNRWSKGELSHSGGYETNQLAKYVLPIGDQATLTMFGTREYTKFYLSDAGPGATAQQVALYGKNFGLTNIAGDEHNYKWNYEAKASDFEYIDLKGTIFPGLTGENQLYTYYYANKTTSVNDITGLIGVDTSRPNQKKTAYTTALPTTDVAGYDKLNMYRVWGDVVRLNKDWSFGTLKVGGLAEISSTDRHNLLLDLTQGGIPDLKFTPASVSNLTAPTNAKLQENSKWFQWQVFADFEWRPIDALKISPGVKFVDFRRDVNASNESVAGTSKNSPLAASNTYTSPLYFLTANYHVRPDLAVYGQVATSFLIPALSVLYSSGANVQSLQPERTTTYQGGVVYSHGAITADADVYRVDGSNFVVGCNVPNPTPGNPAGTASGFCNAGHSRWTGAEAEAAYAFDFGLSLFGNGSIASAKQLANAPNVAAGIPGNVAQSLQNAPRWTYAVGAIYNHGPWQGSLTYKNSGAYAASADSSGRSIWLPGYDTLDGSVGYDFGRLRAKLQVFNILDKRAITSYNGSVNINTASSAALLADPGLYLFQAGRTIEFTLAAKLF